MSTATEKPGVNPLPVNPDSEVDLECGRGGETLSA